MSGGLKLLEEFGGLGYAGGLAGFVRFCMLEGVAYEKYKRSCFG